MPAISTYSPTGDPDVDGLLSGRKWAVDTLTFSFPTDPNYYGSGYGSGEPGNNFEAFNTTQQTAVRAVLQTYEAVANISFNEVTESATKHGDLRFAETDAVSTAWGYYPSTSDEGGDTWFNNSKGYYDNPVKGDYAWLTVLHEIGHAMGLKHPHEVKGSFNAMPTDTDSHEYTVMSYKSYAGSTGGFTNRPDSYPQTLMMYDVAALQTLYGANYSTNSGDTVYQWSATTGEMFVNGTGQGAPAGNKIFLTVWDGGGSDTYDFSNYASDLVVDLRPGGWTTTSGTQLANLGSGVQAVGNIANALLYEGNPDSLIENAVGGSGNDQIVGNAADNVLTGGAGNDTLQGGAGTDTAVYSGLAAEYDFWSLDGGATWEIGDLRSGNPDGTDILIGIEFLQFADLLWALGDSQPSEPAVNSAPTAKNDAYAVSSASLSVAAAGVLGNDSDADGDTLSALLEQGPTYGTLTLNADGSFVYTPFDAFSGTDSFSYKAFDGEDESSLATVTLTVESPEPVNSAPTAEDDAFTVSGATLSVAAAGVLGNDSDADGDTLSALLEQGPDHGSLTLNADGSFVYTPNASFAGTDSFVYTAFDGEAASSSATVTLTVEASEPSEPSVNTAPTADDDSYNTSSRILSVSAAAGVLGNDGDADGDTLSAVLVQGPARGSLTLNADGSFSYKPFEPFDGTDSFTYRAFDGEAESELATVTLDVAAWNSGGGKGSIKGGKGAMAEIQDANAEDSDWGTVEALQGPADAELDGRGLGLGRRGPPDDLERGTLEGRPEPAAARLDSLGVDLARRGQPEDWEWGTLDGLPEPADARLDSLGVGVARRGPPKADEWFTDGPPNQHSAPEFGLLGSGTQEVDFFGM